MTLIPEKSKRKNDARQRRFRLIAFLLLIVAVGGGTILYLLMATSCFLPSAPALSQTPGGTLYYQFDQANMAPSDIDRSTYGLDLETRTSAPVSSLPPLDGQISNAISHNGQWRVVWTVDASTGRYNLATEELETDAQHPLGSFYLSTTNASWSPDDEWIAITAYIGQPSDSTWLQKSQIQIIHRETGEVKPITDPSITADKPLFSPQGHWLGYTTQGSIWIMNLVTGAHQQVLTYDKPFVNFFWSPDGQWIAYSLWVPDPKSPVSNRAMFDFWIINIDGTRLQPALPDGRSKHLIGWGP